MAVQGRVIPAVRLPLLLEPQPEGGFTVTSPLVPELITEGDNLDEVIEHVQDAWATVLEFYEDDGRPLPPELFVTDREGPISVVALIPAVQMEE
ncbi:MAG: type II toxin-antitoxin system HicB family antitoxin [Chloroflexi bacterium]|nr:type II toxin-antitoxin system HicB family antitoxin [Chloroflexota bacterium]